MIWLLAARVMRPQTYPGTDDLFVLARSPCLGSLLHAFTAHHQTERPRRSLRRPTELGLVDTWVKAICQVLLRPGPHPAAREADAPCCGHKTN
jgi:hypothetical protein